MRRVLVCWAAAGPPHGRRGSRGTPLLLLLFCVMGAACWAGAQRLPLQAAPKAPSFDANRAYRDLVKQCEFGPRVPGTQAHEDCATWLCDRLGKVVLQVRLQRFIVTVQQKRVPLVNLIVTINPKGQGHILLCAHWDSRPTADRDPSPSKRTKPVPGANDGASGTAVLLEIARALTAAPPKQKVTIVLFDGEDYGSKLEDMLLGSRHFAERYKEAPPDWAVLLDMVGDQDLRLAPELISQQRAPAVVERIWSAAAKAGCKAFVREPGPAVLDDHVPLLDKGIPAIDVIDFDYPYWHTAADTPDKCSPASLEQVGRAVLQAIADDAAARAPEAASSSSQK